MSANINWQFNLLNKVKPLLSVVQNIIITNQTEYLIVGLKKWFDMLD